MTEYCRLCAELKDCCEIVASIYNVEQSMEQKLRACCQWTQEKDNQTLPHSVCTNCLDKLEKCWIFSQSVQLAQQKLLEIFGENENGSEIASSIKQENESETEIETEIEIGIEIKPPIMDMEEKTYDCCNDSNKLSTSSTILASCQVEKKNEPRIVIKKSKPCQLDENVANLSTEKMHECPVCGTGFRKRWNLTEHIQRHSYERPFECSLCHKRFLLKFELKKHLMIHVFSLKERRENKLAKKQLKRPPKKAAVSSRMLHKCEKCGKILSVRSSLKEHMETIHSNIYPFECWLCHKIFKTRRLLRSHRRIHMQQRISANQIEANLKYICEQCGRSFKRSGSLRDHVRSAHLNERPFKCDICGMGYKLKGSLRSHQITHMEYQHKCTECEKAFRKKSSLKKHMEYHTGSVAKPFECDFCGKGFRFAANYAEHRRIHTGETPYACEYCTLKFRTMSSFYTHLKKTHGISKLAQNRENRARITAMSTIKARKPSRIPK